MKNILEFEELTKRFPGVIALNHTLMNGKAKSLIHSVKEIRDMVGRELKDIYPQIQTKPGEIMIVGGGSQNELLCQFVADGAGRAWRRWNVSSDGADYTQHAFDTMVTLKESVISSSLTSHSAVVSKFDCISLLTGVK